ncbi:MAG: restriction endonuclease subunit S [Desulfarculales bacterium]|jgi:type I restriction enzyme S subunit|nr:restriction endonuclease subunit S [Desulfarculales bacterium]
MNTKQLRQKILDLAIRGKLVPQDPTDEPASMLLERIRAEKEKLIRAGKIKAVKMKATADKSHYGEFEIPGSWEWVRLGDVCELSNGISKRKGNEGTETIVLRLADLGDDSISLETTRSIRLTDKEITQYGLENGDLLFVRVNGSKLNVGKTYVYSHDVTATYCDHLMRGRVLSSIISCFLKVVLRSTVCRVSIDGLIVTTAGQNTISQGSLKSIEFPLPPLSEQHRIVVAIESAFAIIDEIETAKGDLAAVVSAAKSKILSLAISGKLVPQDPTDEPASALLERIRAEKENLIKTGKIKHGKDEKAMLVCRDNSHYGKLPEGWVWARVIDICEPQESKLPKGDAFRYIDIDAIDNKRHQVTKPKIIPTPKAPSRAAKGVRAGDTLFSMVRPYLQNIALVTDELSDCIVSTGFYVCRPIYEIIYPAYLYWFFVSDYAIDGINAYMRGDNSPSIRKDEIDNFGVPLPPLAEQWRIVAAIETVFAPMDNIFDQLA